MKAYRIRVSSLEQTHIPGILFADKKESERNYAIPSAFGAYEKYM
jgi:A/G-specific adenine glycosylase